MTLKKDAFTPFIEAYSCYECTKGVITVSATTFQKALLAGCNECGIRPDYIVNVPDIGSFPFRCNNLFFSKSKFKCRNCRFTKAT